MSTPFKVRKVSTHLPDDSFVFEVYSHQEAITSAFMSGHIPARDVVKCTCESETDANLLARLLNVFEVGYDAAAEDGAYK